MLVWCWSSIANICWPFQEKQMCLEGHNTWNRELRIEINSLIGSLLSDSDSISGESEFIGQVTVHKAVNRGRLHVERIHHSGHAHQRRLCEGREGQRLKELVDHSWMTTPNNMNTSKTTLAYANKQNNRTEHSVNRVRSISFTSETCNGICKKRYIRD